MRAKFRGGPWDGETKELSDFHPWFYVEHGLPEEPSSGGYGRIEYYYLYEEDGVAQYSTQEEAQKMRKELEDVTQNCLDL